MNVLMYMPAPMVRRCFSEADLDLLRRHHRLVMPDAADGLQLANRWPRHAREAQVLITGWHTLPLSAAMLEQATNLKLILHAAGSVKHLLPATVWDRNVRVATANEALSIGVAETTLGMIIAGTKGFFPANALTHAGGWKTDDFSAPGLRSRDVYGSTIGIIGASKAGRHVIRLLRAFEVNVLLYDPTLGPADAEALGVTLVELDELMRCSDVVSLHAPALPQTRHMLGRRAFGLMKDGAIFINTARGMIVDEAALVAELRTGRLWAFIDVTEQEPPPRDHPFRTLPNVVLTPHIAGAIANGCQRLGRSVVEQLTAYVAGEALPGEVTQRQMAIMA